MENNTNLDGAKVEVVSESNSVKINSPKLSTPVAIITAGFLIMIAIFATNMKTPKISDKIPVNDQLDGVVEERIMLEPVSESDHILGDINKAEIVIVEFSDLECPYCKTFHAALQKTFAKYSGKIAWVYRHFPLDSLHPKARNEALASECAATIGGNDAFWKYIDIIFANTPSNNGLDSALLPVFALIIGLNKALFTKCLIKDTNGGESLETTQEEKVSADYQDGVRAGVTGTPHSILILKDGTQIPIKGADIVGLNKTLEVILK